ncbi:MAG: hypothetical protein ACM3ZV_02235 [Bacillota bacterium]
MVAVAVTTAAMGAATHLFWQASDHRYADEILRKDLNRLHVEQLLDFD